MHKPKYQLVLSCIGEARHTPKKDYCQECEASVKQKILNAELPWILKLSAERISEGAHSTRGNPPIQGKEKMQYEI